MLVGKVGPPTDEVVETEIDGSVALFHPESGQALVLNATASDIWRLSDGELSLDGLIATLATAYGLDTEAIGAEVEDTVARLRSHGFLPPDGG